MQRKYLIFLSNKLKHKRIKKFNYGVALACLKKNASIIVYEKKKT